MKISEISAELRPNRLYTVAELTQKINTLLEENFPFIWIKGEISNFKIPRSGHLYFTLKDTEAQINAVMFRGQARSLRFQPEDGMDVTGLGRLSVYALRGAYQIIFEYLEPSGAGALQIAFEQLKQRLADEGLFSAEHKKHLPFLPQRLALITSPTGAAVQDMIRIAQRRFANLAIQIVPVSVQGPEAAAQIAAAIALLNERREADVAVLARGGGSLEDLQAFNTETVARAIYGSRIPIVSAVGHETDFTIADFVADLRAPTPSAAAELIVPVQDELQRRLEDLIRALKNQFFSNLDRQRRFLELITQRLVHPRRRLQDLRLRLDDLTQRIQQRISDQLRRCRERLNWRTDRLRVASPGPRIEDARIHLNRLDTHLAAGMRRLHQQQKLRWQGVDAHLCALNPNAVLARGYSITRTLPQGVVVRAAASLHEGQPLEITVAKGRFTAVVSPLTPPPPRKGSHESQDI